MTETLKKRSYRSWLKRILVPLFRARYELKYWLTLANHDRYAQVLRNFPPVVIGGTGGSGTRVFVSICENAGYFPGTYFAGGSNDALQTKAWIRKWLPQAITSMREGGQSAPQRMNLELNLKLINHRRGISSLSQPWVIKNPRFMLALPYLHSRLPNMKFIHVVRDGRDVAFSKNQRQLIKYGSLWLGDELADAALPVRSIALWARTNLETAEYGQTEMNQQYLRIRFEDLCRQPVEVTAEILDFLNSDAEAASVAACVRSPSSIGRWLKAETSLRGQMLEHGGKALDYFGYTID